MPSLRWRRAGGVDEGKEKLLLPEVQRLIRIQRELAIVEQRIGLLRQAEWRSGSHTDRPILGPSSTTTDRMTSCRVVRKSRMRFANA
jgi:hypothetical protein